jgi:hypothetical protein
VKAQGPPPGKPWVWFTRELLNSDAWRALGLNARRLIDFLLIEHMKRGGKANGKLVAPWRQLRKFGIGDHFIAAAIEQCEHVGLIDCRRGVGRRPTFFALTWLPRCDDAPPSNRWRTFQTEIVVQSGVEPADQQSVHVPAKQQAVTVETAGTRPVAPAKQQSQIPISLPAKQQAPYRKLLTTAKPKGYGEPDDGEPRLDRGKVPVVGDRYAPEMNEHNPHKPNVRNEIATIVSSPQAKRATCSRFPIHPAPSLTGVFDEQSNPNCLLLLQLRGSPIARSRRSGLRGLLPRTR